MAMESPKETRTYVRKPMANPTQQRLVDALTPMGMVIPTPKMPSQTNPYNGRIETVMDTEITSNLPMVMSASMCMERAQRTVSKDVQIPMAMVMPTHSVTSSLNQTVLELMHSRTIRFNGAIKTVMASETITKLKTRQSSMKTILD